MTPPPFSLGAGSNLALHQVQPNCLVVNTQRLGKILVGSPPEIVKRFLPDFFAGNREALPTTLLLTKDLVKGGNIQVEPEFPVYANKYLANRKLRIVGTPEQIEAVRVILNESIFGPRDLVSAEERQELDFFIKKRPDGSPETLEDFEAMLKEVPELARTLSRVLNVRPVLSQVVFLKELPSDVLTGLSARFRAQKFANGTRIISQGDQPKGMYLVKKGEVTVTVQDKHVQHLVAKLGPGQIFGEIALVKGVPCSANVDVSSAEGAEILVLSRKDFEKLSRDIPKFTFSLLQMADRRLKEIQKIEAADRRR